MKKEDWINNVIESASQIKQVEANPFLFEKTLNQINVDKAKPSTIRFSIGWATAILLFIALNLSTILIYQSKTHKQNDSANIEALSNELNSNTTYNY